jgi:pimeloyl-ACP methyl ester carboxylesterase
VPLFKAAGALEEPPQNMKEYDPEWARAFWTGTVSASCDHARMLSSVKVPVLFTHHFRMVDAHGRLLGAIADVQAEYARKLIQETGSPFTYLSFPRVGHSMHGQDPGLFTKTLVEWAATLPPLRA